ncbi:uncharacterized protein METZ01_LOCUS135084 [marine metagenome]|uniref:Uncharacterized protein n=1 Tax=marine metagenome TaxID=408172 RepID=A0A381YZ55_9ZZZZ
MPKQSGPIISYQSAQMSWDDSQLSNLGSKGILDK